ncbi:MAG TPA: hypothetical protein VKG43_06680 [Acidimicrobiales bacterium]|nr:hypothetical protein [Acidimicrobiales bacterium]
MATLPPVNPPELSPPARLQMAWGERAESDYLFNFWTAIGWSVLTFGIFALYILYQLVRRMRDHNRRRLELLDAARTMAWDEAVARGQSEELRGSFERLAGHLEVMRVMLGDFRDPVIWVLISIIARGIVDIIVLILNDVDVVRHGHAESGAEGELDAIFGRLGVPLPPANPVLDKARQNYVGRIVATVVSFGIYGFWWLADVMRQGNAHFEANWAWEDALVGGTIGGPAPPPGPAPPTGVS